jgi:hypothetical protein
VLQFWWSALGIAIPLIGADAALLPQLGYEERPPSCGTVTEASAQTQTFVMGASSSIFGDVAVFVVATDAVVESIVFLAGGTPLEADVIDPSATVCDADAHWREVWTNDLSLDVVTSFCAGHAVIESRNGADDMRCALWEGGPLRDGAPVLLPRRK